MQILNSNHSSNTHLNLKCPLSYLDERKKEKICLQYLKVFVETRLSMSEMSSFAEGRQFYWFQFTGNFFLHSNLKLGKSLNIYQFHTIFEKKISDLSDKLGAQLIHVNFRDAVITHKNSKQFSTTNFINELSKTLSVEMKKSEIEIHWENFFRENLKVGCGSNIENAFCDFKLRELSHRSYQGWNEYVINLRNKLEEILIDKKISSEDFFKLMGIYNKDKINFQNQASSLNFSIDEIKLIIKYIKNCNLGNYLPPMESPKADELNFYRDFKLALDSSCQNAFELLCKPYSVVPSSVNLYLSKLISNPRDAILLIDLKNINITNLKSQDRWISRGASISELPHVHEGGSCRIHDQANKIENLILKYVSLNGFLNFSFGDDLLFFLSNPKWLALKKLIFEIACLNEIYFVHTIIGVPGFWKALLEAQKKLQIAKITHYPQHTTMNTSLEEAVQRFIAYYWNIAENKPSKNISKLFNELLPNLPKVPTLEQAVRETQAKWVQKMRWDVKRDDQFIKDKKEKILPLLQDLGLTSSYCPEGHYDTALLLGGRANIFLARCYALSSSIKGKKINVSQIDILVGKQLLHPLELDILKNSSLEIYNVKTEEEMALAVSEKMLKPLGITCNIIATDLKDKKPCTEQIVNTWLEIADRAGNQVLIVSDPQFALYQHFQCMESLYKKNIIDVKFDLLSLQLESHVFDELKISMEETQGNPILLHLDTIARTLYTIQSQN